jgi:hypothetical protein
VICLQTFLRLFGQLYFSRFASFSLLGTVTVIAVSLHDPILAATPPMVTLDVVLQAALPARCNVHRAPNL